jgi:aspartyl protease family protein
MLERALIVVTLAGGAALGLLWPLQKDAEPATADAAAQVAIARSSDKHYYAEANVNGQPVRFLIDTGASETALTEEDAKKVGLTVDPAKFELIGEGASGMVRGQYVQLASIDVDGIRQSNAKAVIVEGAPISLLGQPFLESIDEIVIRKGEMILKDSSKG